MKKVITIFALLMVAGISGMIGCSTSKRSSDNVDDIRLWYAFTLQTLDFMIEASDRRNSGVVEKINEKVMLTLADSAYLLNNELAREVGVRHLKVGMCERLPRLLDFSSLIDRRLVLVDYENKASEKFVGDSVRTLVATVQRICN